MSKRAHRSDHATQKVVSIFSRKRERQRISRLAPEFEGTEVLYANDRHPDTLFSLKALAWARYQDGSVHALVPWMNRLVSEETLSDPLNGHWEGYRLAHGQVLFNQPPAYKVAELEAAWQFYGPTKNTGQVVVTQEIPDTIGTHAVLTDEAESSICLLEIVSWQLLSDGAVQAMVADEDKVTNTPVLPGDDCLIPAQQLTGFRYFFQHGIANRIKEHDPEALAAIALLGED
jgi:hypothetical protein